MKTFCQLLEMYLQRGYEPYEAYRLAFRDYHEQEKDAAEFYHDHPEGVNL